MPRCKAQKSDKSDQCGNNAMIGQLVCHRHGGLAPAAKQAAARRIAEAKAEELLADTGIWNPSAEPVTDPIASYQRLAGRLEHMVEALGARLDAETCPCCGFGDLDSVSVTALNRAIKEAASAYNNLGKLDLGKRALEIEEQKIGIVILAMAHAIKTRAPGISHVQMGAVQTEFFAKLRELEQAPPEAASKDIVWT